MVAFVAVCCASLWCLSVGKTVSTCCGGLEEVIGFLGCLQALSWNEICEQRTNECGQKKGYQLTQGHLTLFRGKILFMRWLFLLVLGCYCGENSCVGTMMFG